MQQTLHTHEDSKPRGIIRLKRYVAGTLDLASQYLDRMREYQREGFEKDAALMRRQVDRILAIGFIDVAVQQPNLIMLGALTGKDLFIQYLCASGLVGATVYPGGINWAAIGTGSTAPANSDTQLTSETLRVAIADAADVSYSEAQLQFFFTDALLANGTYHEVGTFMNATVTANSGQIFNHALLGTPYVKTTGVDTTLEVDITLT